MQARVDQELERILGCLAMYDFSGLDDALVVPLSSIMDANKLGEGLPDGHQPFALFIYNKVKRDGATIAIDPSLFEWEGLMVSSYSKYIIDESDVVTFIILHELCHYLQLTNQIVDADDDEIQADNFAHSVLRQLYYEKETQ